MAGDYGAGVEEEIGNGAHNYQQILAHILSSIENFFINEFTNKLTIKGIFIRNEILPRKIEPLEKYLFFQRYADRDSDKYKKVY